MASVAATAARRAASLARVSFSTSRTPIQPSSLIPRRNLAGSPDHHGRLPDVNAWEAPMNPSRWKEEHFMVVNFTWWALFFYGAYKFFTRGQAEK